MQDERGNVPARALSRLEELEGELSRIEREMAEPEVMGDHRAVRERAIRRAALEPIVQGYRRYKALVAQGEECRAALRGSDAELAELAREELPELEARASAALHEVLSRLVSSDDARVGSVMLEVRAGAGGDEAALWARDLLDMYEKCAAKRGWTFELLDVAGEAGAGGVRSAIANVRGEGVWSSLLFEAGVHSVKRVPATEAQGRIHTSTATVAVLPEPEAVDVKIDWSRDVEEHVTTSQGPGGQNVNKVATAVQLRHRPTGIVIRMQESKSQHQNREKARRLLATRLHELERQRAHAERTAARSAQIGGGERSEKIRTYRYKEGIVADERLPGQYNLRDVLAGDLSALHRDLMSMETRRRLAEL